MVQLPRNIKSLLRMVRLVTLRVVSGAWPLSSPRLKSAPHQVFSTPLPDMCIGKPVRTPAPFLGGEVHGDDFKTEMHQHLYFKLLKIVFG